MPPQRDVPIKPTCEKCGSENIIPNIMVTGDFAITVEGKRRIEGFDPVRACGNLQARVCGDCGHVELIVENAAALLQAYRKIGN